MILSTLCYSFSHLKVIHLGWCKDWIQFIYFQVSQQTLSPSGLCYGSSFFPRCCICMCPCVCPCMCPCVCPCMCACAHPGFPFLYHWLQLYRFKDSTQWSLNSTCASSVSNLLSLAWHGLSWLEYQNGNRTWDTLHCCVFSRRTPRREGGCWKLQ